MLGPFQIFFKKVQRYFNLVDIEVRGNIVMRLNLLLVGQAEGALDSFESWHCYSI